MENISSETLLATLSWRYATKAFDPSKSISDSDWKALEAALVLAPSSFGLQPWKFMVVSNKKTRADLQPVSWNQSQIVDASHLVVFSALKKIDQAYVEKYVKHIAAVRNVPEDSLGEYKGMMVGFVNSGMTTDQLHAWACRQVYIALGVFLTSAAMLKIDACPMEGIDTAKYDEILGLSKTDYTTLVVATAGYRSPHDKYASAKKVRFPADEIISHHT